MWDRLRAVDIEQAKQELERRRADMLARHAREIEELQASHAEIETLHGLIAAFAVKFKAPKTGGAEAPAASVTPTAPVTPADPLADGDADASLDPDGVGSSASSAVPEFAELAGSSDTAADAEPKPAAAAQAARGAPPPRRGPPPPPSGELPRTNFEAFSQAISKASY